MHRLSALTVTELSSADDEDTPTEVVACVSSSDDLHRRLHRRRSTLVAHSDLLIGSGVVCHRLDRLPSLLGAAPQVIRDEDTGPRVDREILWVPYLDWLLEGISAGRSPEHSRCAIPDASRGRYPQCLSSWLGLVENARTKSTAHVHRR